MIRPATLADLDGLKAAVIAAFAPYAAQGLGLPPLADGLDDDIRNHHVWVADDRGIILGGIVLTIAKGTAHIINLAVHPIGEGQGLGRRLIDIATTAANAAGCSRIMLATHKEMTGSHAFYARLGWFETSRDADNVIFALDLT